MAHTMPTVDNFQDRFPEFDNDDDEITRALAAAARSVDTTWLEADYAEAILNLAAHILAVSDAGSDALGQDDIRSLSIGPLSLSYGDKLSISELSTTAYGETYRALRRRNVVAVAIV